MIHYKIMAPVQKKGLRALQIWCSQVTAEYDNVRITDLSNSFRDGLAFNAIIHHFRPDLFDYKTLKPSEVRENNAHAFHVAETELGIPALLDPEDMVDCEEPDKFSVSTYLAQLYHMFKNSSPTLGASPTASPALRSSLTRLSSSESESNDSLLSSSSDSSPPSLRSSNTAPAKPLFNRADLIAKYGEDIFSCSSSPQPSPNATPRATIFTTQSPSSSPKTLPDSALTTPTKMTPVKAAGAAKDVTATHESKAVVRTFSPRSSPAAVVAASSTAKKNESSSAVASVRKQFEAFAKISAS